MGRIRTIKPEFFRSRSLARVDRDARLTFAGLWTEADDHGRGIADARILKGALWALDDDVTHEHVSAHLRVLDATGHITLYTVGQESYYEIVNWTKHQAAAYRRGEPRYPGSDEGVAAVSHDGVQESADVTPDRAGTGNEEQGTGNEEETLASAKPKRKADPIFDALVDVCDINPAELTDMARGPINKAVKELKSIGASPEGIRARAANYRVVMPHATLTPLALTKHYPMLGSVKAAKGITPTVSEFADGVTEF